MRIISGKYKGRHFDVPRNFKARPTTDFAKENLFNILLNNIDFENTEALDLFSGTGSISLELLSRGCPQVTSIEIDAQHFAHLRKTASALNEKAWHIVRDDAFRFIKRATASYDLIFADPPYALEDLATLPDKVFARDILHPGAYFILEHPDDYSFESHPFFLKEKKYGNVHFSFFEKK